MTLQHTFGSLVLLSWAAVAPLAAQSGSDPVIDAMHQEIDRSIHELKIPGLHPPFYFDARIVRFEFVNIKASAGSLVFSTQAPVCNLTTNAWVGDYQRNNDNLNYPDYGYSVGMPITSDPEAVHTALWWEFDKKYKKAAEAYETKLSVIKQTEIPEEDLRLPDLERRDPVTALYPEAPYTPDVKKLEKYVCTASSVFAGRPEVLQSSVRLYATQAVARYANSEGTSIRYPDRLAVVMIYAQGQAPDGQEVEQSVSFLYPSLEALPSADSLQSVCRQQLELLNAKLQASTVKESYCGPVLFEGTAVCDLVNEFLVTQHGGILAKRKRILSPQMQGFRYSPMYMNELEGLMNKKVISRDLTLTSLSGTETYRGEKLLGYYPVDAQGVAPDKELVLIGDGVLRTMLTDRTPTLVSDRSNGHARISINGSPLKLLPGVLRLSSRNTCSPADLKQRLIDAAKEEDYEYAYIVRRKAGEKVDLLYRVRVSDGSEELLRGGLVKNMTLRAFKRILGASDEETVQNFLRDDVKMTFIVPTGLLFEEIDIVKDNTIQLKKPYIVPRPE